MRKRSFCVLLFIAFGCAAADERPWTVRDSIEMSYFVAAKREAGVYSIINAQVVPSPDGRRFFVISKSGDLTADANVYQIKVYDVAAVREALARRASIAPPPMRTQTIRSRASTSTLEPGLYDVRWTEDSAALSYIAAEGNEHAQVRRWDLATDRVTYLTQAELGVESYRLQGDVLVFTARMRLHRKSESEIYEYPITWMRRSEWASAFGFYEKPLYATFVRLADGTVRQLGEPRGSSWAMNQTAFVSPDAKTAIVAKVFSKEEMPERWKRYRNPAIGTHGRDIRQFVAFDLASGEERPLLDAPTGNVLNNQSEPTALWYDNDRVILVNAMLPLGKSVAGSEVTAYVLDYDVSTGKYRIIGEMPAGKDARFPAVVTADWVAPGSQLLLREFHRDRPGTLYTRDKARWKVERVAPTEPESGGKFDGLNVAIRQGLNDPPSLVASNALHELTLSPPDPVLQGVRRLAAEWIEWKAAGDKSRWGVLVTPESPAPRGGYPLILQFVDVEREVFLPDGGSWRPGFAAQAMAARGFAVLSFDPNGGVTSATPEETRDVVAGADSAVALLRDRGLIDPTRVGVMGFSRMGYRALYLSTHPKEFVPAATIVQDSYNASYLQYLAIFALTDIATFEFDAMYEGGTPFWSNKQAWLADAPGFNMDRMHSPLLMTEHYAPFTGGLLGVMEAYAALTALRRPVDVAVYSRGDHVLQLPRQRKTAMEVAIDWMSFWIKGEECQDPEHLDRNQHWRKLRANWEKPTVSISAPRPESELAGRIHHP